MSAPWAPTSTRAMMRSTAAAAGAAEELLEAADLARLRRGFEPRHRADLQIRDMLGQRRFWRHPENEVDIVGAAPVDDLRAAIVAVGPDQDPGVRPIAPDRSHEAAKMTTDFSPTRPHDRTDEPARAVEHHDRLEAVSVDGR